MLTDDQFDEYIDRWVDEPSKTAIMHHVNRLRAERDRLKAKVERLCARGIEDLRWSLAEAEAERDQLRAALVEAERQTIVSVHGMDACDLCGVPVRSGHESSCPFRALGDGGTDE